jgi:hypothetical protein
LRALLGLSGAVAITLWVVVVALRAFHPFELEWQEGGMWLHVERVRAGLPLYVEPSLDFCPFPYPPIYAQIAALVPGGGAGGFLSLRLVSIVASLATGIALYRVVQASTRTNLAGLTAAGIWFAGFGYAGAWMDVGRVDALAWAMCFGAFAMLSRGQEERHRVHTMGPVLLAAILAIAACWTKQTAAIPLAAFAVGLILEQRRAGFVFAGVFLLGNLAVWGVGHRITDGWLTFHVIELLRAHPTDKPGVRIFWTSDLAWLLPGLLLAFVTLRSRSPRTLAFALGLLVAAGLGRSHIGAFDNVRLPALLAVALLAGLALRGQNGLPARSWVLGLALVQMLIFARDPRSWVPSEQDRLDGERVVAELARREGPVMVLGHSYLGMRAGHAPTLHVMAWLDLSASEVGLEHAERLRNDLSTRARLGQVRVLVAGDWRAEQAALQGFVEQLFLPDHDLWIGGKEDRFWPVTGAARRPRLIYVRP